MRFPYLLRQPGKKIKSSPCLLSIAHLKGNTVLLSWYDKGVAASPTRAEAKVILLAIGMARTQGQQKSCSQ